MAMRDQKLELRSGDRGKSGRETGRKVIARCCRCGPRNVLVEVREPLAGAIPETRQPEFRIAVIISIAWW